MLDDSTYSIGEKPPVKSNITSHWIDPEVERPRGFTEYVSGDQSWNEVGIRIKWTQPHTPGPINMRASMDQPLKLKVCVETKVEMDVPPDNLTAWCWTPIITEENPCGIWKEIELRNNPRCMQWDDCGIRTFVFVGKVRPMNQDSYRVTFNIKWYTIMIWANSFQDDSMADIGMNPSVGTQTNRYPMVHFTSNYSEGQTDKCIQSSDITRPAKLSRKRHQSMPKEEDLDLMIMY